MDKDKIYTVDLAYSFDKKLENNTYGLRYSTVSVSFSNKELIGTVVETAIKKARAKVSKEYNRTALDFTIKNIKEK